MKPSFSETAQEPGNWKEDVGTHALCLQYGDMELRVTKARLNHGFEWGLYNQGQVVLQGQWCENREEAKRAAVLFAEKWMVDDIRN